MPTQTYTPEEIGARIRARAKNPEALNGFTDAAIGKRAIERSPKLQALVKQSSTISTGTSSIAQKPFSQLQNQPTRLESAANPFSPGNRNLGTGKSVISGIGSFLSGIVKPIASTAIQFPRTTAAGISGLVGNEGAKEYFSRPVNVPVLGEVRGLSAVPSDVQQYGTKTAAQTLGQAAEIGSLLAGGGAVKGAVQQAGKGALKQAVKTGIIQGAESGMLGGFGTSVSQDNASTKSIISGTAGGTILGGVLGGLTGGIANRTTIGGKAARVKNDVLKLISPKLNKTEQAAAISAGRGQGSILFGSRIAPSPKDEAVAQAVTGIVDPRKNLIENVNLVRNGIKNEASKLRQMLGNLKDFFAPNELKSYLRQTELPPTLVGENEQIYKKAEGKFFEFVNKNQKTSAGLLNARQQFDDWLEHSIPKIWSEPRLVPLHQALRDMRNSANKFIAQRIPQGAEFQNSLLKQSLMYEARDNMAEKAAAELGKNVISRLAKKHPFISTAIGSAVVGSGTGSIISSLKK